MRMCQHCHLVYTSFNIAIFNLDLQGKLHGLLLAQAFPLCPDLSVPSPTSLCGAWSLCGHLQVLTEALALGGGVSHCSVFVQVVSFPKRSSSLTPPDRYNPEAHTRVHPPAKSLWATSHLVLGELACSSLGFSFSRTLSCSLTLSPWMRAWTRPHPLIICELIC